MAALPVSSIFVKVREGYAGALDASMRILFTHLRLVAASLLSRERLIPPEENGYARRRELDSGGMRDRITSGEPIVDSTAFVQPETGRGFYGNSARDILTGPGAQTWNTVLAKNFALTEQVRLQFRWEMFNAFNRTNFYSPGTNISGGDFGLVTGAGNMRKMLFGLRLDY